jgi:hypothetical protein
VKPVKLLKQLLESNALLVGLGLATAFSMAGQFWLRVPSDQSDRTLTCQEIVRSEAALSRQQLAQLLNVPQRTPTRTRVQAILKQPYCRLPNLSLRAGAATDREMYRLAFDSQTDLIVLYEGKSYVGYGFQRH